MNFVYDLSLKSSITAAGPFSITFLDIPPVSFSQICIHPPFLLFPGRLLLFTYSSFFDFQWKLKQILEKVESPDLSSVFVFADAEVLVSNNQFSLVS